MGCVTFGTNRCEIISSFLDKSKLSIFFYILCVYICVVLRK